MATWDALYTQQFDDSLKVASQQMESRLLRTVTIDKMAGQNKFFEKILPMSAPQPRGARFQQINLLDAQFERRMLVPISYDETYGVDSLDRMRSTIEDPSSKIMQGQAMAFHRDFDSKIIAAATGTAVIVPTLNGTPETVSLPDSQNIAIDYCEPGTGQTGNQGMTVGKMKAAKAIVETQEGVVPGEEIFLILTSAQKMQLLRDAQVTNMFYNDYKPLIDGDIGSFLGCTFIRSELVANTATAGQPYTGQGTALMYPQSAIEFSWLEPFHGRVDYLPERRGETYGLKSMASYGATRMFEERVMTITTDNTE